MNASVPYSPSFQDVDADALLLEGLSKPWMRTLSFYFHGAILIVLTIGFLHSPLLAAAIDEGLTVGDFALKAMGVMFLYDVVRKLFFPKWLSPTAVIHRYSVLGAIEQNDIDTYNNALAEIEAYANRVSFSQALKELLPYESDLRSWTYLRIVAHQRRGKLGTWLNSRERIQTAGRLVYLFHLAERKREDHLAGRETEVF